MSFRNPSQFPTAYLVRPGGHSAECRLTAVQEENVLVEPLSSGHTKLSPGETVYLTVDSRTHDPERCIRGQIAQVNGSTIRITLADPAALWNAAKIANSYNRRQSFRVSTLDRLPSAEKRFTEALNVMLEQGRAQAQAEMLDLSLTGCGLRIDREQPIAPPLGTVVFVEVVGGDLAERLRLPARVERYQVRDRYVHLGLAFLRGETRLWNRVETQIASYLMSRQQRLLGRRAG